jgi:crotonobetainyl-CoA:carnitine CoA-transferase CaiB-like acyl-CoA transferase
MGSNPLTGNYKTKDGHFLALTCLQAAKYWAEACEVLDRAQFAHDERFADQAGITEHHLAATEIVAEAVAERTIDEWRERFQPFSGQWAVVQTTLEASADPQTVANGYIQDCVNAAGATFQLAAAPIQFGDEPAKPGRAPEFNEHGDAILESIGMDWDTIIDLKVRGVVA